MGKLIEARLLGVSKSSTWLAMLKGRSIRNASTNVAANSENHETLWRRRPGMMDAVQKFLQGGVYDSSE
jgi:hypothetical protein